MPDVTKEPITIDAQAPGQDTGTPGTVQLDPDTLKMVEGSFVPTEIEPEDVDVYGISFPKSMLPLGSDSGYWTSEPLLDLSGDEDEELVRVWLHAPAYKWPGKDEPNRQKGT